MFVKSLSIAALAAVAVNASPVIQGRQATSVVESVISSAVSSALPSGAPSGVSSAVSSVVANATSAVSSAVSGASSVASSAVSTATATAVVPTNGTTGNESYPAYPCPPGYLLTYTEQNVTIPARVNVVLGTFNNWANGSYFGALVLNSTGRNGIGSTHTLNVSGIILEEELVNVTASNASRIFNWNLTNGPVEAMGVGISNYSTVLSIYDPDFDTTGVIGNTTTVLTFTNFCATSQAEGITLVSSLGALEIGQLQQAVAARAPAPSSVASSSVAATSSAVSSAASSAVANVTSSAGPVTSAPASAASSISSEISSAISSVINATTTA